MWKNAQTSGILPAEAGMAAAAEAAGAAHWRLDEKSGMATRLSDTPLMLNSFTKRYIIERAAAAALRTPGVTAVVVNIGGDLVVRGTAADKVSVVDPRSDAENSDPAAVLNIADRAVATSGNYRRGFEIGGEHYSHIVDPSHGTNRRGDHRRSHGGGARRSGRRRTGHRFLRSPCPGKPHARRVRQRRRIHAGRKERCQVR